MKHTYVSQHIRHGVFDKPTEMTPQAAGRANANLRRMGSEYRWVRLDALDERTRIGNTPTCDLCGEAHGENDCPEETDVERTTRENIEAISEMPTPEQDAADQEELIRKENRATILAALRVFQDTFEGQDAEQIRASKYGDYFDGIAPLCTEDIDFVCEAITFGKVLL